MSADRTLRGVRFAAAYTAAADRWLAAVAGAPRPGVALVAVGGYGRGELCPGSDLDVLLAYRGVDEAAMRQLADRVWYPMWDSGLRVDHSVRSLRDALRLADAELEVAVGLLDARCVWGDEALVAELRGGVHTRWRRRARRRLPELADAVAAAHRSADEVAFLLEPDLKHGRGGLRDVTALRAAAAGSPVVPALDPVEAAGSVLLAVRIELHRLTGRPDDRLVLEAQDDVALGAGYRDADDLMAAVATAARTVMRASDDGWRRVASWVRGPRGVQGSADRALAPGLALRDGEIVVTGDPADPALALRAAATAAETGAPFALSTLARLAAALLPVTGTWTPAMRQSLVALLATGRAAVAVFEALDEADILVRLLPEWAAVRSRPQRNALHRFTVDRHLCEAAAEAAALTRTVARPDLLLVGAWLHDIGKGYPGDHTAVGMDVMRTVAGRMGFDAADVDTLVALVELHLLLPDVATRQDLDEPATVTAVAARVASPERLELLAALSQADGRATGAAAWGPWKAALVADLVGRCGRALAGVALPAPPSAFDRAMSAVPPACSPDVTAALAAHVAVDAFAAGDPPVVAVVGRDRPGFLADVAGVLALNRLTVQGAACATTADGMVLDVFAVEHEAGDRVDAAAISSGLEQAAEGRLPVDQRVMERVRAYSRRARRRAATVAATRVLFTARAETTAIEVRAADDLGLLHRVATALEACGLDVRSAKVSTLGHEVVDTFTVGPLPPERRPAVESAILAAAEIGAAGLRPPDGRGGPSR